MKKVSSVFFLLVLGQALSIPAFASREMLVPGLNMESRFDWEHTWSGDVHPWLCDPANGKKYFTCLDGTVATHNQTKCEDSPQTLKPLVGDKCSIVPEADRRVIGGFVVYIDLVNISDERQTGKIAIMDIEDIRAYRSRIISAVSVSGASGSVSRKMASAIGICPAGGTGNKDSVFVLGFKDTYNLKDGEPIKQEQLTADFAVDGKSTNRIQLHVAFSGIYGDPIRRQSDYGSGIAFSNPERTDRFKTTYTRANLPMLKIFVNQDKGALSGVISSTELFSSVGSGCIKDPAFYNTVVNTFATPAYVQDKGIGQIIQLNGGRPF